MKAEDFLKIIADDKVMNLKKMKYKYPQEFNGFLEVMKNGWTEKLNITDFDGNAIVYQPYQKMCHSEMEGLLKKRGSELFYMRAMEEEILSTFSIERIDSSKESVRKVLRGLAPENKEEERIYGMKKGLEFIADPQNKINETNLHRLYMIAIDPSLEEESRLKETMLYRDDEVYLIGNKIEHQGISYKALPDKMRELFDFIETDTQLSDFKKAAAIHFLIGYFHPYFDGNGRIARLMHLWFLSQQGYDFSLFFPFSKLIQKHKKEYYQAYQLIEENKTFLNRIDITPFLVFFTKLYEGSKSDEFEIVTFSDEEYEMITEKERDLWQFVITYYGEQEFSTKQLEKDYKKAAYATIRSFVIKFEKMGKLHSIAFTNKKKYKVIRI